MTYPDNRYTTLGKAIFDSKKQEFLKDPEQIAERLNQHHDDAKYLSSFLNKIFHI